MEELGRSASLPRTGAELAHVVSMFLKTSNAKDDADKTMAQFIHQAMVRRSVVVNLIATMKRKGHRAYKHIDMNEVIAKSAALPENGVPPEMIRLLPEDDMLDNIEVQTNRTPIPIAKSVEEASDMLETKEMNAVVNERRTEDEVDINARHNAVLQDLIGQLNKHQK